jgi:hypothetical protein
MSAAATFRIAGGLCHGSELRSPTPGPVQRDDRQRESEPGAVSVQGRDLPARGHRPRYRQTPGRRRQNAGHPSARYARRQSEHHSEIARSRVRKWRWPRRQGSAIIDRSAVRNGGGCHGRRSAFSPHAFARDRDGCRLSFRCLGAHSARSPEHRARGRMARSVRRPDCPNQIGAGILDHRRDGAENERFCSRGGFCSRGVSQDLLGSVRGTGADLNHGR